MLEGEWVSERREHDPHVQGLGFKVLEMKLYTLHDASNMSQLQL